MRKLIKTILTILTTTTGSATLHAADGNMVVPGGELDPAFPNADVYKSTPSQPTVPATRACQLAARYVDLINAGKYREVAALYTDDATFLEPIRPSLHGRAQIEGFYTGNIGTMQPQVRAVAYFGNETECLVELSLEFQSGGKARYGLVSVDHFVLNNEGRIASMTAFARPRGVETAGDRH